MFGWLIKKCKFVADHKDLGRWGERQAEKFLKRRGLRTLARNFSCKTGEIDLVMVAADGGIVFVEVKTRADESFAAAESAVTGTKRQKLIRAARFFLRSYEIEERPYRFDVVTIALDRAGAEKIEHFENAFVP